MIPLQHVMLSRPSGALELQVPALFPDILSARDIDCSVPAMEYREQESRKSSHTYDHARTSNTLPTTTPGRLI